jgi:hypothetical protein
VSHPPRAEYISVVSEHGFVILNDSGVDANFGLHRKEIAGYPRVAEWNVAQRAGPQRLVQTHALSLMQALR